MRALAGAVAWAAANSWADVIGSGDVAPADPGSWTASTTGYIGNNSSGAVIVTAGSTLLSRSGYVGYNGGATGLVSIDGAGSTWANNAGLTVGVSGAGTLNITNGGAASSRFDSYVGLNPGFTGTVNVDGTGSTWTNGAALYVGYFGTGTMAITNGGMAGMQSDGILGNALGATGTVSVDGSGSMWTSNGALYVGNAGNGVLNITHGGQAAAAGATYIAAGGTGTGAINFGDSGGTLTTQTLYAAAAQVTGTGTIVARGLVSDGALVFGATQGLNQSVNWISGSQNVAIQLDMSGASGGMGDLGAGYQGAGTLTIAEGVAVTSGYGYLGYQAGSAGMATVTGSGSTWTNNQGLFVGNAGAGTLNILNGGVVTVTGTTYVAAGGTATGAINFGASGGTLTTQSLYAGPAQFSGSGTIAARGMVSDGGVAFDAGHGLSQTLHWMGAGQNVTVNLDMSGASGAVGDLGAGYQGAGTLTIAEGVAVTSGNGYLGYKAGSTGMATVSGTGSTWANSGNLTVGSYGNGALNVINGGRASSAADSYLGYNTGAKGTVNVDGTGSAWTSTGTIIVGYSGTGTVNITNGGQASGGAAIGEIPGSTGTVNIDGAGSAWIDYDTLVVGANGTGALNITNGGRANSGFGIVGLSTAGLGTVMVDGPGSTWSSGFTNIGHFGQGTSTLNISNGGNVTTQILSLGGHALVAMNVGDGSALNIGTGSLTNDGVIRLKAAPGLAAGTYSPITAGSWSGAGTTQALGGSWSDTAHTFMVTAAANGTAGQEVGINLLENQRVLVTDPGCGESVEAGFQAAASASNLTLSATLLTQAQAALLQSELAAGAAVVSGWTFDTSGYTGGDPVFLALGIGSGYAAKNLAIWHYDGAVWAPFAAGDLSYDGMYADFTVTGFSGYAVAAPIIATSISTGTVSLSANNMLPKITDLTVNGGTLDLNGFNQRLNSLSDGGVNTGLVTNSSLTASTLTLCPAVPTSTTYSGVISGNVALTMAGTGTTTITGAANYSGPTIISAGKLVFGGGVSHSIGGVSGAGTLQVDGGTTLTSDGVNMLAGTWTINGTHVLRSSAAGGAYGNYTAGHSSTVLTGTSAAGAGLTFGTVGNLDIRNNGVIVEATPATKDAMITQIASAITGGKISSSTAATDTHYAVVLADNGIMGAAYFGGMAVDDNSLVVTQALKGDGNLDGLVNAADLLTWKLGLGHVGSNSVNNGDFNNDGLVNAADLLIWKLNLGATTGAGGAPNIVIGGLTPSAGGTGLAGGAPSSAVPEPSSLLLLGLGAAGLLGRRRRR
jgi:T5SS/PEP-CTERM-associated repeat protein